ncbi:MAG: hypothetical protein IKV35_04980, partial [Clostridia bacterium]|nr:hypothetical protein [Clostridia bacterium]
MKMKKSLALLLTLAMLFGMVSSLSTVVTSAAPVLEEYESSTFIEKYTFDAVDYYRHADWMVLYTSKFNAYTDYEANKSKYADINKAWFSYHYSEAACKDRTATNQYGTEVIINPYGIVTEIQLNVGNAEIPRGGMVISGNGTASTWLRDNVKVGDCIVTRDSSGDGIHDYFDVFRTTKDSKYTADSKACQFNKKYTYVDTNGKTQTVSTVTITEGGAGVRTGTNEWNNDVLVKATGKGNDGIANHAGYVVKFGGNNIEVPEGYFALSFSGQTMHDTGLPSYNGSYLFQQYAAPGAIVNIGSSEVFFRYDAAAAKRGAYLMTGLTDSDINVNKVEPYSAKAILEDAKKNFELVDVDAMQALYDNMVAAAQAMNNSSYTTKSQVEKYHATINKNYEALCALEYEKRSVEMRAVWIRPLPNDGVIRSEKELDKLLEDAVLEQKKLGYNQIFIEAFYNSCTVFPVPADAGYKTLYYSQNPYLVPDEMTCGSAGLPGKNTKLTEPYDMLQKFIDICKENDIEPHIWWEVFYVGYKRTNGMTDSLFDYSIAKQIMNNSSYSTWLNKGSNGDLYYGAEADGALQYFLSPANDDAREFLLKTFKYIWTT